jgi:hypothetical protein
MAAKPTPLRRVVRPPHFSESPLGEARMKMKVLAMATGAAGAAFPALSTPLIMVARYEKWTSEYCACILIGNFLFSLLCAVPAFGVAHHYQNQAATCGQKP